VTQRVATPEVETNKVFWLVGDGVMEATPDDKSRTYGGSLPGKEYLILVGK